MNCSIAGLDLNDKFGRIGAAALEKAIGLQGGQLFLPRPCLPK